MNDPAAAPKKKRPVALIVVAVLALLCVCALPLLAPLACFVPVPRTVTVVPAVRFEVTGTPDGAGISGARVVLNRGSDPHGQPRGHWVQSTDAAGRTTFSRTTASETILPLMMHGVPFYYWTACVDAPGRAARTIERLEVDANGAVIAPVRVELDEGDARCSLHQ